MTLEYAPAVKYLTYEEALLYCFFCNYNGHTDWRLPTEDEAINHSYAWRWYAWELNDPCSRSPLLSKSHTIPVRTSSTLHSNKYMHTIEELS